MKKLRNENVTQIGLVVDDVEKYARAYARVFKIKTPGWTITEPLSATNMKYHGKPSHARAKLAFIQAGNLSIELIEPVGKPSVWSDFLKKHGPGVHHIAFAVHNNRKAARKLGLKIAQKGEFRGGRYAYLDSRLALGVELELLESDKPVKATQ